MISNGAMIACKQLPVWIAGRKKETRPVSRKPRNLFGSVKPFLVHLYNGEVHTCEASCMKGASVHIKKCRNKTAI